MTPKQARRQRIRGHGKYDPYPKCYGCGTPVAQDSYYSHPMTDRSGPDNQDWGDTALLLCETCLKATEGFRSVSQFKAFQKGKQTMTPENVRAKQVVLVTTTQLKYNPELKEILDGIPGNRHAKRAILVAEAGRQSVMLIGDINLACDIYQEVRRFFIDATPKINMVTVQYCHCGAFADPRVPCLCTEEQIRQHQATAWLNSQHVDIIAELIRPSFDEIMTDTNLLSDLTTDCVQLFKAAYDKFSLTLHEVKAIIRTARTIAALDNSPDIRIEHLSEAIQYRSPLTRESVI